MSISRRDLLLTGISTAALAALPAGVRAAPLKKVAVILSPEGRGDLGWNDLAWHGSELAKAQGLINEYSLLVSNSNEIYSLLNGMVESKEYDLIVSCSSVYVKSMVQIAAANPNQNFAQLDANPGTNASSHPGVLAMLFNQEQMSALVGALGTFIAAEHDMPSVGLVLGREIAVLQDFEIGYKFGVAWAVDWLKKNKPAMASRKIVAAEPAQRVLWTYTGTFQDPAKGKTAAEVQIQQGAAVIYQVAGGTGLGVLSAVADHHTRGNIPASKPPYALGVDADQDWINPYIVASGMKRVDMAVLNAIKLVQGGTFRDTVKAGDGVYWLNLANRGVDISDEKTLDQFIAFATASGAVKADKAGDIKTGYAALRAAQPAYAWGAIAELRAAIEGGSAKIPKPSLDPKTYDIQALRKTYG